jgi:hypothetical protein
MKELVRVRVQYATRQQCCKTHKRPLPLNLTLNLLTTTKVAPPSNASKWQMGFNSVFKGLRVSNKKFQLIFFVVKPCINDINHFIIQLMHTT